jgi:hypothetical protein
MYVYDILHSAPLGIFSMVSIKTNSSVTFHRITFTYNVMASGNVVLLSSADVNAVLIVNNCTFSVNGSSAVVPQSFINHLGDEIYLTLCTFENVALSYQALIVCAGMCVYMYACVYICV